MSQTDVATAVGISRSHLTKMETGGDMPSRQILGALAKFYGVSMDYLESGTEPATPDESTDLSHDPQKFEVIAIWDTLAPDERRILLTQLRSLRRPAPRRASNRR